jgi:proline dehydrogenase
METSPTARRLSSRFVAGDALDDALNATRNVNREGISATLDYLGENVRSLEEAGACRTMYQRALSSICESHLDSNVSLKLTQFGMDISEDACRENVRQLVEHASGLNSFVRIDMESSDYTDRTLRLVTSLHAAYKTCGAVIQAYLYRSQNDVDCLCREGIRVRLCKGAYLEPPSVAFQKKSEVDANFVKLAHKLLTEGTYPAIATHDERILRDLLSFIKSNGILRDRFEFQMLYGIRRDLQRRLIAGGYRLRLYIPFGEAWYPYFMRRLAERPANVLFIVRNLFRE